MLSRTSSPLDLGLGASSHGQACPRLQCYIGGKASWEETTRQATDKAAPVKIQNAKRIRE